MQSATPQFDAAQIAQIVREVMRRLDETKNAPASSDVGKTETTISEQKNDGLVLSERVITLESIQGKIANVRQVRVSQRAVVTPSVVDALRDRKIQLVRESHSASDQRCSTKRLSVATTSSTIGRELEQRLAAAGFTNTLATDERVSRLTTQAIQRISANDRLLIVTQMPYTAVCVANRDPKVRACSLVDWSAWNACRKEINPNCLVIHETLINQANDGKLFSLLNEWVE
jgi:hypothetical protein